MISLKAGQHYVKIDQNLKIVEQDIENYRLRSRCPILTEEELEFSVKVHSPGGEKLLTLVGCRKERQNIFLNHLKAPEDSSGFGRLGLGIFWAVAKHSGARNFAIRFGGGENSIEFLESLGFDDRYVHNIKDVHTSGSSSAVVGEVDKPVGDRRFEDIDPITLEKFPTEFFEEEMEEDMRQQIIEDIRQEIEVFEAIENSLESLKERAKRLDRLILSLEANRKNEDYNVDLKEELEEIALLCHPENDTGYTRILRAIKELCEEREIETSQWKSLDSLQELVKDEEAQELESRVEKAEEAIEVSEQKEKEIAAENNWNMEKVREERNYQETLENEVSKHLRKLPDLGEVTADIEQNEEKYLKLFS